MGSSSYDYRKAHGICTNCGLRKALPNHTRCAECAEKDAEYSRRYKEMMTAEDKARSQEKKKAYTKRIRADRRSNGRCIYCGAPLSKSSGYCCIDCLVRQRRRYLEKQDGKIKRSERPSYGLCYRCGKPIDGGSLCEDCRQTSIKNLHHKAVKTADSI